jgi:hypothetical protein
VVEAGQGKGHGEEHRGALVRGVEVDAALDCAVSVCCCQCASVWVPYRTRPSPSWFSVVRTVGRVSGVPRVTRDHKAVKCIAGRKPGHLRRDSILRQLKLISYSAGPLTESYFALPCEAAPEGALSGSMRHPYYHLDQGSGQSHCTISIRCQATATSMTLSRQSRPAHAGRLLPAWLPGVDAMRWLSLPGCQHGDRVLSNWASPGGVPVGCMHRHATAALVVSVITRGI